MAGQKDLQADVKGLRNDLKEVLGNHKESIESVAGRVEELATNQAKQTEILEHLLSLLQPPQATHD